MAKIKVLIVADSALIRGVLAKIIDSHPDLEVVGQAPDAFRAGELIDQLHPDVLTLDAEMPRMNGLKFLGELLRQRPMPVVMVSSHLRMGNDITLRALELGAVDFIARPRGGLSGGYNELVCEFGEKIRGAARARVRRHVLNESTTSAPRPLAGQIPHASETLVFVGASTGGTEALKELLTRMPASSPGLLIAQHMPESFTHSFAQRLDSLSAMTVKEAVDNERVSPGHAYIAPGHSHLLVKKSGAHYYTELSQADPVNRHRPSVDVLFDSAARVVGPHAVGVIMTGMGKDGARGMLAMRQSGAYTIAQDEASCVVFGMPKAAIELGAVQAVASLRDIAARVLERIRRA